MVTAAAQRLLRAPASLRATASGVSTPPRTRSARAGRRGSGLSGQWEHGHGTAACARSIAHGADYVTRPRWRPPEAGIVSRTRSRGNELYWFGRGAAPRVYILDLDENRWTNTVESMAPGGAAVAWSEDDAVMLLPSGVWLRVTADGEHLTGADRRYDHLDEPWQCHKLP